MNRPNILIVNDDGIEAHGIRLLAEKAARIGDVWVVAPDSQCSAMSQCLTIFEPLPIRRVSFPVPVKAAWSVGGTPADCIKAALSRLLPVWPDLLFSGVNNGYNTGFDIAYSGTIGACYEAVMNGIPAIAFSARMKGELEIAERYMPELARELIDLGQKPGEIWNVNFPGGTLHDVRGILRERRIAPMQLYNGVFSARVHPEGYKMLSQQGVPIGRGVAPEGSDIAAVLDGYISVGKIMSPVM